MIIPNGNDIIMSKEIFDQDPLFFMDFLVGVLTISRVRNCQADRLERLFDREDIKELLCKDDPTFADYEMVLKCCI